MFCLEDYHRRETDKPWVDDMLKKLWKRRRKMEGFDEDMPGGEVLQLAGKAA